MFGHGENRHAKSHRKGMSIIKANHVGFKTKIIKDVTGAIHKCTTKAYYAQGLNQDLFAGREHIKCELSSNSG